jgi:hypothetical protein
MPAIALSSVLLPAPLGPTMAVIDPDGKSTVTPSIAGVR